MNLLAFAMPGSTELIIVAVIAVLLFGKRLPKLAYDFGSSFTQFKKGLSMPIEELEDCRESLVKEAKDFNNAVKRESREVENAVKNA